MGTIKNKLVKHIDSINIIILLSLVTIGSILIILFIKMPKYQNELTYITAILGGMGTIYSAFFIGKNLKIRITQDAIHRSFELIHSIDNYSFMKNITLIEQELQNKEVSPSEFYIGVWTNN